VLLLACAWIATASFAEHVSAEFPLCRPERTPCCPPPANNNSESCPACHVSVSTVAAKDASEPGTRERRQRNFFPAAENARPRQTGLSAIASRRELTRGLRYRAPVFELKEDLRI